MATDKGKEIQRTQAEIDADVKKAVADAAKALAEAKKAEAEARKIEADASISVLLKEKAERESSRHLASDEENHVYRFDTSVTSSSVKACIQKLAEWNRLDAGCPIEIIFSSPGGEIISGMSLFDYIQIVRQNGHYVTTGCAGMAASMAGILLQAGDHRWVGEQSWIMIHRAAFGAAGKTFEVEDEVEFVKRIEKRIIDIFVKRSHLTSAKIKRNWDRKDWWITCEEALELGLVDEVRGSLA